MESNVLEFKNIYLDVVNKDKGRVGKYANLLNGISFKAYSGRVTVVMGASGSGKTNLFNTIVGDIMHSSKTYGHITFNGEERSKEEWFRKIAYLEQDDVFLANQTVKSFVTYTAQFKNPGLGSEKINLLVQGALENALIHSKSEALIGSLSGGERKRVMIASTIVSDRDIIFLDEPTTGLDSHTALLLVKCLKDIAIKRNKMIIMTVHQPGEGLFNMFDDILYLAKGGTVFFSGKMEDLKGFLAEHGLEKPESLSLSEFVFELHSENPFPEDISQFHPKVDQIIKDNIIKERETTNNDNLVMNQYTSEYFSNGIINLKHIFLLIKRHIQFRYSSKVYITILIILILATASSKWGIFKKFDDFIDLWFNLLEDDKKKIYHELAKSFLKNFKSAESLFFENVVGYSQWILFLSLSEGFAEIPKVTKKEIFYGEYTVYSFYVAAIIYESLKIFLCVLMNFLLCALSGCINVVSLKSTMYLILYLHIFSFSIVFFRFFSKWSILKYLGLVLLVLTITNCPTSGIIRISNFFIIINPTGTLGSVVACLLTLLIPIYSYNMLHFYLVKSATNKLKNITTIKEELVGEGFKRIFYDLYKSLDYSAFIVPNEKFNFSNYPINHWIYLSYFNMTYFAVSSLFICAFIILYGLFKRFDPTVRLKL